MDKENLKKTCHVIVAPLSGDRLDNAVEKILQSGCVNLKDADEKVISAAIMAALFEDMMIHCLDGGLNINTKKATIREYKNIKLFVPSSY